MRACCALRSVPAVGDLTEHAHCLGMLGLQAPLEPFVVRCGRSLRLLLRLDSSPEWETFQTWGKSAAKIDPPPKTAVLKDACAGTLCSYLAAPKFIS